MNRRNRMLFSFAVGVMWTEIASERAQAPPSP
jgi:hypothetical protein